MSFIIHVPLGSASEIGSGSEVTLENTRTPTTSNVTSSRAKLTKEAPSPPDAPVRAGRPTREQASARQAELLDRALGHFLARGYEPATIEAIAAEVNMTKRTIYARYPDKAALFRAALQRGTERRAVSAEEIERTRHEDLEETLVAIAKLRIGLVSDPEGAQLQRLINTESYRFPDIIQTYYTIAALPTVRFLADRLEEETRAGRLAIDEPMLTANVFMSMVVSGTVRFILSGNPLPESEVDHRVRFAIRLFLNGALPRDGATHTT